MTAKSEVLYQNRKFKILYIYESGYCEIQEVGNPFQVELALLTDVIPI